MTTLALDDFTVAYLALALWALCGVALCVIVARHLRRPMSDLERECARVDAELDARRDAIRRGWNTAGAAADDAGWSWPDNPADATHGHYEFRPSA